MRRISYTKLWKQKEGVVYQSVGSWLHQKTVFYMESCRDYVYLQCEGEKKLLYH